MNLGLYVGSFNPVHKGHIKIINEILMSKIIDKAIILPSKGYWNKTDLININDRINMLKFYETDNILVDSSRYKYDYTYQVINSIKEEYKEANIFLIIGADNLEKFHLWKNIDEILENKIIVMNRNGIDPFQYINKFKQKADKFIVVDIAEINISSTEIRQKLKNKESLNEMLIENVINYIEEKKLYGGENYV